VLDSEARLWMLVEIEDVVVAHEDAPSFLHQSVCEVLVLRFGVGECEVEGRSLGGDDG
jgi:hypothetical protein